MVAGASEQENRATAFEADLERDKGHRPTVKSLKPLRRLVPFITPYWGTIAAFIVFLTLASALTLSLPAAARLLLDCGFNPGSTSSYCQSVSIGGKGDLSGYFKFAMGLAVVLSLTSSLRYFFVSRLGERVVADLRRAVFDHITRLSPAFYEKMRTGEVLSRLTTDTTLIQTVVGSSISIALRTTVTTLGAILLMAFVNLKLTLAILTGGAVVLVPIVLFGQQIRKLSRSNQDKLADASARAGESLSAIETVQAFTREPFERDGFAVSVENTYKVAMRRVLTRTVMTTVIFAIFLCSVIGALWFGSTQVQSGAVSSGEILQFMMYAFIAVSGAGMLTETWTELMRAAGASERLMELLAIEPEIKAPQSPIALPSQVRGELEFIAVSFAYPSRPNDLALNQFSLKVRPGETVALVGPSGAGKSTVFQLLLRFYDPRDGQIALDGIALDHLDPVDLRNQLGVVQQNAPLFSGNVMENIRYGRLEASDDEVRAAAKIANADEFISALPDGYGTDLGEKGSALSGGQRQRIAIARAILRNAPILLLDEATSALDAESERAVQDAFSVLSKDRTTIVIAHRLSTVLTADRIAVLDAGQVVEEGTHESLMAQNGLYARLARLQFDLSKAPDSKEVGPSGGWHEAAGTQRAT